MSFSIIIGIICLRTKINDEKYKVYCLQTGHSLGAVMADILCCVFLNNGAQMKSITFENPGSKPIIVDLFRKSGVQDDKIYKYLAIIRNFCNSYQADVNIINTTNEQLGIIWRLESLPYNYDLDRGPILQISSNYYLNLYYILYTVLDQHQIIRTYEYLKENGVVSSIENPRNHVEGYIEYLDGSKRKKYWENYFQILWNEYEGLRKDYENDYEQFRKFWQKQLAVTRKEAIDSSALIREPIEFSYFSDEGIKIDNMSFFRMFIGKSILEANQNGKLGDMESGNQMTGACTLV